MPTRIGELVRGTRKGLGLTQAEVAKQAGISRSYLAQVELGTRNPTEQAVRVLARVLGLSVYRAFDAADLLTRAERLAAEAVTFSAEDGGLSDTELARLKDQVLLSGGTIGYPSDDDDDTYETVEITPRPFGPLLGWDDLSNTQKEALQTLVDGILAGR